MTGTHTRRRFPTLPPPYRNREKKKIYIKEHLPGDVQRLGADEQQQDSTHEPRLNASNGRFKGTGVAERGDDIAIETEARSFVLNVFQPTLLKGERRRGRTFEFDILLRSSTAKGKETKVLSKVRNKQIAKFLFPEFSNKRES